MILWHFTRCGEFSKGLMCLSIECVLVSSGSHVEILFSFLRSKNCGYLSIVFWLQSYIC